MTLVFLWNHVDTEGSSSFRNNGHIFPFWKISGSSYIKIPEKMFPF